MKVHVGMYEMDTIDAIKLIHENGVSDMLKLKCDDDVYVNLLKLSVDWNTDTFLRNDLYYSRVEIIRCIKNHNLICEMDEYLDKYISNEIRRLKNRLEICGGYTNGEFINRLNMDQRSNSRFHTHMDNIKKNQRILLTCNNMWDRVFYGLGIIDGILNSIIILDSYIMNYT